MKYKLTKAEQETVINFDNELDTASIYTHDSRLIKKLRELRKQYPEQFILEHREHGSVTYTIPKRCVGIRPPYSEKRREQQRQEAKENGLPFMEKGEMNDGSIQVHNHRRGRNSRKTGRTAGKGSKGTDSNGNNKDCKGKRRCQKADGNHGSGC